MALPIGTILDGRYKIVQVLGEGGMGTVYKVEQVDMPGYFRAIKELLLSPNLSEEDRKAAIERFNKEVDLLFHLKHPRIPMFMFKFQEWGNYYYVMEFVPGKSLDKILEENRGPLDEEKVINWMMQVCEALTYIHTRTPPIILRDLKPGNVMVTPNGDVQLIDFGIARRFDPNKRTNTENLGTISYASPEHLGSIVAPGQKRSANNPGKLVQTDARSDIYSLGATMYHLLTNYEPDPIQTPAPGSIRAKNPRLRTVQVGNRLVCPVEQVIIKAMQQDPAHRFQSAEAMRTALQQCLPNQAAPATISIPAVSPNSTVVMPVNRNPVSNNNTNSDGIICPRCGYVNRPNAKFCKVDGQPLFQGATAVPPQVNARIASRAPIASSYPGQRFPIQSRPVQPIPSRPAQPIRARPVQAAQTVQPGQSRSIPARPAPINSSSNPAAVADPAVALRMGRQHLADKNYLEAIRQFQLARGTGAGQPSYEALYNLGRAYRQYAQSMKGKDKKLFEENMKLAAEQFAEATRIKPDAVDAFFQLGMTYRDLGLYSQAASAFLQARQLAPQDEAVYYQLGLVSMDQGYLREAEAYFLDGLKRKADHPLILVALGRLYVEMNRLPAALKALQEATRIEPASPDTWYELGKAYSRKREWKTALDAFEKARQLMPDNPDIYTELARCYLRLKMKNEARRMVQEALQRDPNNVDALRVQKQL
jgi:serine/threonine protein kinase/cytochrome c-type biogenesis protein CcmH/NrfG